MYYFKKILIKRTFIIVSNTKKEKDGEKILITFIL